MTEPVDHRPAVLLLAEEVWGSTLHAMRSLADRDAEVLVVVAGDGASIYRTSTACTAATDIATREPGRFCAAASKWAASNLGDERPIVVIPLSDRLAEYLNQNRDVFPERFRLALADPAVLEPLLDKRTALAIAEKAGLCVPPWEPIGADGAESYTVCDGKPVAIRPARWTVPGDGYFKVVVTDDQPRIDELIADSVRTGTPMIAQRHVAAPEDAVEFGITWRSRDKAATAVCTGRKRRQSAPQGGVMVWGETVELPDVSSAAAMFLDRSGFTGLGGIEFIRTANSLWFIEFNPRLEAIHFLATAAGVDTVAMAYEELAGTASPTDSLGQREAGAWLGSAWLERLRVDSGYRWRAATDRWSFSRLPVRTRAIWSWKDPQPGLRVFMRLTRRATSSTLGKLRGRGDKT